MLKAPRNKQADTRKVLELVTSFALSFRPVYREMKRVLKPGGVAILQIRDLRYGGSLLPLVPTHWDLMLSSGFSLITRVAWRPGQSSYRRRLAFVGRPVVGSFLADDYEEFLVFASGNEVRQRSALVELEDDPRKLVEPVWTLWSPHRKTDHVWGSPRVVVHRLILLFSEPGDLVVDPFMGYGNTLEVARSLNRRSAGWELDPESYARAVERFATC